MSERTKDTSWHDGWHGYHPCSELHEAWSANSKADASTCPASDCDCCDGVAECVPVVTFYVTRDPEKFIAEAVEQIVGHLSRRATEMLEYGDAAGSDVVYGAMREIERGDWKR